MMNIFNRALKGETETISKVEQADSAFVQALLGQVVVSRETCMSIPIINRSVSFVADMISTLDWHVYEKDEIGNVIDKCDYRTDMLNKSTNSHLKSNELIKNLVLDYLIYGSAYCYVDKDRNHIKKLTYVNPIEVSVLNIGSTALNPHCELCIQGNKVNSWDYTIMTNGGTDDGLQGLGGIINNNRELIELAYLTNKTMKSVTNGSRLVAKSESKLSKDSLDKLNLNMKRLLDSDAGVLVLNQGVDVHEIGRSSVDNQFVQMFEQIQKQLSYLIGIPLSVLDGTCTDLVYNQTIKSVILPIIETLESAISDSMLLEVEKATMSFNIDTKALLRTSLKERYDAYSVGIKSGFLSRNDVRKMENMDIVNGLDLYSYSLADVLYDPKTGEYKNFNMDSVTEFKNTGGETDGVKTA